MNIRTFKNQIYNELSSITKAMANPNRLEIIELLAQGPCSVENIAKHTDLGIANASQHLQTLKAARLVKTKKRGRYSFYTLANKNVFEVWNSMRELGFSQNAEIGKLIKEFRKTRPNLESVTSSELLERIQEGKTLIVDVRPSEEYDAGHIASAWSIPQDKLIDKLKDLPKNKQIVAYCRGPLCTMADDTVELLNDHGFKAVRLETGFPEWKVKGFPVAQSS